LIDWKNYANITIATHL